jgi:hypothetical protein
MTRTTSLAPLGSEFDSFLFAPVGEDKNGMLLSVVSALARLDIDPWQEAGELTRLPREAAIARLASWIAALPDRPSANPDPGMTAGRLIALLPHQTGSNTPPSPQGVHGTGQGTNSRVVSYVVLIVLAFLLGAQFIIASRAPQAKSDNTHAPPSSTVAPDMPRPSPVQ